MLHALTKVQGVMSVGNDMNDVQITLHGANTTYHLKVPSLRLSLRQFYANYRIYMRFD